MFSCDALTPSLCSLTVREGTLQVRGLNLTYWKYSGSKKPTGEPIVMVHGGPGWSHHYMLPLKQQACRGRDVYFYDQMGAGLSERPVPSAKAAAPWLFDLSYYAEELTALIAHLGLTRHHVLGSSWGTIVAQLYALTHPTGLSSLVLSGPLSDSQLYIRSQWDEAEGNLGSLPPFVQRTLKSLDAAGRYDSAEYVAIARALTPFFTVRTTPAPDCFETANNLMNSEIYIGVQGASEFTIGGVLKHWNITGQLPALGHLPTLLTYGRYDTMRPPLIRAMARALRNARTVELPHSGHCSMIDDPGLMNDAIDSFLLCVELGACSKRVAHEPSYHVTGAFLQVESAPARVPPVGMSPIALMTAATAIFVGGASAGFLMARRAPPHQLLPSPAPRLL